MLIVPTVLHLADPAFGQETGNNNGYGNLPPSGYGPLPLLPGQQPEIPGGVICQGTCDLPIVLPSPTPTPTPTPTSSPTPSDSTTPSPTPQPAPTPTPTSSGTTPTPQPTPTPTPEPTGTGSTPEPTPTPTPTPTPDPVDTAGLGNLLPGFVPDVVVPVVLPTEDGAPIELSANLGAVTAGTPVTVVFTPPAPTQTLERTALGEVTLDSLTQILSDPAVLGIRLTSNVDAANAQLEVRTLLPNQAPDAVPVAAGTGPASVTISVGTGAAREEFKALQILEISAPGIPQGGVEGATVGFRVTQAQLDAMGLAVSDIRLLHLDGGKWVELETRLLSGPVNGVYTFEADTPHFSYFAVAGAAPQETTSEKGVSALGTVGLVLAGLVAASIAAVAFANRRQR